MENNHYLCIVIEKEINNMSKKITKLGSVNPCVLLFLYDKDNKDTLEEINRHKLTINFL